MEPEFSLGFDGPNLYGRIHISDGNITGVMSDNFLGYSLEKINGTSQNEGEVTRLELIVPNFVKTNQDRVPIQVSYVLCKPVGKIPGEYAGERIIFLKGDSKRIISRIPIRVTLFDSSI